MKSSRRATEPSRILVRGPNPVGDLVMATASLADVRKAFPRARISLLLRPERDGIVEGADFFDELLVDESARGPSHLWKLARRLRRERFDLAILYPNSLRTALVARLAGIPERVGYRKGGQTLLLTRAVEPVREAGGRQRLPMPMTEVYARLVGAVGVRRETPLPVLAVGEETEARAREVRRRLGIGEEERLVGLVPGASFGASKLWPPERFAEVADRLGERTGLRAIILAGPGEGEISRRIATRMARTPVDTSGDPLPLDVLKPFVRDLACLIATDSGPRHYAVAFGVPTVVVIGPTDPRWSAVDLERCEVVRHEVECGPCHLPICPLDHRCMREITVEEVLEAVERLEARVGKLTRG